MKNVPATTTSTHMTVMPATVSLENVCAASTTLWDHAVKSANLVTMATPPAGHLRTVSLAPARSVFLATSRFFKHNLIKGLNKSVQTPEHISDSLALIPLIMFFSPLISCVKTFYLVLKEYDLKWRLSLL